MEYLNKIELNGVVGNFKITPINETKAARFSLLTQHTYKAKDGCCVVDCTWFSVTAFESERIKNLDQLEKGKVAHVIGRVRNQNYIDAEGKERQIWEVVADQLQISDRA